MPKIIGCNVDDVEELCINCPCRYSVTGCQEYRRRYDAVVFWDDDYDYEDAVE